LITEIEERKFQVFAQPNLKESDRKESDDFENNLERIFLKLHQNTLQVQRSLPNTRLLLGFANKLIETVKAKEVSSDFFAD
jgi:hypothetical protein